MEQVFFNVPLFKLEPIFKKWFNEVLEARQQKDITPKQEEPIPPSQAAKLLGLAEPTIYTKHSRGELPGHRFGKNLYFFRSELIELIKKGRTSTNSEIEAKADEYLTNNKKKLEL